MTYPQPQFEIQHLGKVVQNFSYHSLIVCFKPYNNLLSLHTPLDDENRPSKGESYKYSLSDHHEKMHSLRPFDEETNHQK